MQSLDSVRKEIDRIDTEMAALFEQRMNAAKEVAEYKQEHGLPVLDAAREAALYERCRAYVQDDVVREYYMPFIKHLVGLSKEYQQRLMSGMKVAYCGVEGAFAHIAAETMFGNARLEACPDFSDAYHGVEKAEYDCVVLPLENNYAGEVGTVMDLIFSGELFINQVLDLPVHHELMVNPGATADSVKTVVSHPQALSQCGEYLRDKGWETQSFANTALAAQYVKNSGRTDLAAIASHKTAELMGLEVMESGIQDADNNTTRFACLSREANRPFGGTKDNENFVLMFTVQNKAGALAQTLNIIGSHGFNMRNLRSRPMKDLQWNYYFYIEAEGNIHTQNGKDMMRELSAICARLKLVGSFSS